MGSWQIPLFICDLRLWDVFVLFVTLLRSAHLGCSCILQVTWLSVYVYAYVLDTSSLRVLFHSLPIRMSMISLWSVYQIFTVLLSSYFCSLNQILVLFVSTNVFSYQNPFIQVNKYLENYERALSGFEAAASRDPGLNSTEEVRKIVNLLDKLESLLRVMSSSFT